ncbi:hypothetical protein GOBAR_DD03179 [Gossypium barbadense]|nr:hypothetical protein GOBAR_DD03179 [Gossypium barbadense]
MLVKARLFGKHSSEQKFLIGFVLMVPCYSVESHIEDLTQENFSLQRDLEASRTLAESLAAEISSLTDSYNQQAELEYFKMEYANARLECNAADERANILASEVIGLEKKSLRLRSNELKLERQLENSQAEISKNQQ